MEDIVLRNSDKKGLAVAIAALTDFLLCDLRPIEGRNMC